MDPGAGIRSRLGRTVAPDSTCRQRVLAILNRLASCLQIRVHIWSNKVMRETAKVSELKAKLSRYLAQVRNGGTVTVCDRKTPIARLVPVDDNPGAVEVVEAIDADGLPIGPSIRLKKPIDVVALLRTDRDSR